MLGQIEVVELFLEYQADFEQKIQRRQDDIYSLSFCMLMSNLKEDELREAWQNQDGYDSIKLFDEVLYGYEEIADNKWFSKINWKQVKAGRFEILNLFISKGIKVNDFGIYTFKGEGEKICDLKKCLSKFLKYVFLKNVI